MNVPTKCQSVSNVLAIRQQPYGRIYRARVYENTHKMGEENACVVMWKCVFNNVEMRVRWNENTYLIMWKHIFGYGNTRFWLCQDTGTMNQPLRLTGCSLRILRNVRWHFVECSQCFGNPSATFWQSVRSRRGRFIVPAYPYTPTKWRTEMCVWWNEYTYLVIWKHVFHEMNAYI